MTRPNAFAFTLSLLLLCAACGPSRQTVDLKATLLSKNYDERKAGLARLDNLGDKERAELIPVLIQELRTANDPAALNAMGALIRIGSPAADALLPLAEDGNNRMRGRVLKTLATIRPFPQAALPSFMKGAQDPAVETRLISIEALGQADRDHEKLLPTLLADLKDESLEVRAKATAALGKWGETAAGALPYLLPQLKDSSPVMRAETADAIGKVSPRDKEAATSLIAAYQDKDESVRRNAVFALGAMDPEDDAVLNTLKRGMNDSSDSVRAAAERSLRKLNSKESLTLLTARLRRQIPQIGEGSLTERVLSYDVGTREKALQRLKKLDRDTKRDVADLLLKAVALEDGELTGFASKGLAELGEAAAPVLKSGLKNSSAAVRTQSAWALGLQAGKASSAVMPLTKIVQNDKDAVARWTAAQALGRVGPAAKDALPALKMALRDRDEALRVHAAEALGIIGAGTNDALDELGRVYQFDESAAVRQSARTALETTATAEAAALLKK